MRHIKLKTALAAAATTVLVSCGGSSDSGNGIATTLKPTSTVAMMTQQEAARLLGQATFGVTTADINRVMSLGYEGWINDQFSKPQLLHRLSVPDGNSSTAQDSFYASFWRQAVKGDDQLRQRVTFALSQIFVVSFQHGIVPAFSRGVAGYYDTLATHAFGNYRNLIEAVSLHPMMGLYLTSLGNVKESGTRTPDLNYAREIMQLMSIGLHELNPDGTLKLNNGQPIETYRNTDVGGLAKVFTGWSWYGPDNNSSRFGGGNPDPNRDWMPMQAYPQFHSVSEKRFLGLAIPPQSTPNPQASLKAALDHLFNHQNVGPFIGKQLIQRLVTSNPSPQYVGRVAAAFANNGQGVRGDMKAVVKAILLDPEARTSPDLTNVQAGKMREPVLRLANWIRSFNAQSRTGQYQIYLLDHPLYAIAQTPMRSPSVFNFYRPGYVPPNTSIATANLVAPEMQITDESSIVGYLNYMYRGMTSGVGWGGDVKADFATEISLASTPTQLVERVNLLLMAGQMSSTLRNQIMTAVNSVTIPTDNATQAQTAKRNRAHLAVFLTMASPEYLVQK